MKWSSSIFRQATGYRQLFWAGLVNGIGDRFSQVATLSLILTLTGSGMAVGFVFAIRLIPSLIFAPIGGMLADRYSRTKLMIYSDIIRAFVALSFLFVQDAADMWVIYVGSFLLSAGEAIYAPIRTSSIPLLVKKEQLLKVNGLEERMIGFVLILGSMTGGVVAMLGGTQASFVVNAASFLISAMLLRSIVLSSARGGTNKENEEPTDQKIRIGTLQEIRTLWQSSQFLRAMIIGYMLWPLGYGIFNILLSVYAVQVFQMGDLGMGLMYGSLGLGLVIGSRWTDKFTNVLRGAVVIGFLLEGVFHIGLSLANHFVLAIVMLVLAAICSAIGNAGNHTLLMQHVPSRFYGRFFGFMSAMHTSIMGVTMLVAGFMLDFITPRMLGLIGGGIIVAVATCLVYVVLRTRSEDPSKSIDSKSRSHTERSENPMNLE
ncbi:MFS transporter [Paenibacillus terrigena]|uniref:MFS transporter n=1 Tax=Paenibacillus terrigena TaxID=369333 RepID=UPI000363D233|nr:MFS transporter [Paenibacillus terrigena]